MAARFLLFLLVICGPAMAHEVPPDPAMPGHVWAYNAYCCSDEDCQPATPGEVQRAPGGWMVGGTLIPDGDKRIRPSGDTRFHPCKEMVRKDRAWRCLYVPGAGG